MRRDKKKSFLVRHKIGQPRPSREWFCRHAMAGDDRMYSK